ncbi:tyrosine-type recombinase/integrase [Candidimonas humi]|uniref:Tyrosine-type recombinase/integrase n=1 Tax=Candidimonas humi TaxID=683355 RepID=A0ABV8NWD0_9BURK
MGNRPQAFKRVCRAAGISDFRFHDLRHTWTSWHEQRGTLLMVVQELGGWRSFKMVQRYAYLAPSHIAAHARAVNFLAKWQPEKKIAA